MVLPKIILKLDVFMESVSSNSLLNFVEFSIPERKCGMSNIPKRKRGISFWQSAAFGCDLILFLNLIIHVYSTGK